MQLQLSDRHSFCLAGLHEVWEDGQAFKDLHARMKELAESKASIEAARKVCAHVCPPAMGSKLLHTPDRQAALHKAVLEALVGQRQLQILVGTALSCGINTSAMRVGASVLFLAGEWSCQALSSCYPAPAYSTATAMSVCCAAHRNMQSFLLVGLLAYFMLLSDNVVTEAYNSQF